MYIPTWPTRLSRRDRLIQWHSSATEGGHVVMRVTIAIISPLDRNDMFLYACEDARNEIEVLVRRRE